MDIGTLLGVLAIGTLGAFAVMGFASAKKTEARLDDDTAPKSTLAADKRENGKPADI